MEKRREGDNESCDYDHHGSGDNGLFRMQKNTEISRANGMSSTNLSPISSYSGAGYIEHPVSKFDTLAGVAIKYGVEVADVKRLNALVTDLQMFALKSLQIPTPGKHPPSSRLSDDLENSRSSEQKTTQLMSYDLFDSFQSLRVKSSTLEAPLKDHNMHIPADQNIEYENFDMNAHRKGKSDCLDVELMLAPSPHSNPHRSHHRKSKSLVSGFSNESGEFTDVMTFSNDGGANSIKKNDKLVRRRQRSMADFSTVTERLYKKDDHSNGEFLSMTRNSLELRLKETTKSTSSSGAEIGKFNPILMDDARDSIMANGIFSARNSSSMSNLQDPEKGSSSSIWSTSSWNLKTDLQALSAAVVTKSLFDGMPKPTTKFKASLD